MTDKFTQHDKVNAKIMAGLSGKEEEDFRAGLRGCGIVDPEARAALEVAARKAHPEYSEAQVQVFVKGR